MKETRISYLWTYIKDDPYLPVKVLAYVLAAFFIVTFLLFWCGANQ
jgi:hypothetical protein